MPESASRFAGAQPGRRAVLALVIAPGSAASLFTAELHEETVAAWNRYVDATEGRIPRELEDGERFLVLDFLVDAERTRGELLAWGRFIERMETRDGQGERIDVPKGRIHHWRGAVLVPNADLDQVVDGLQYTIRRKSCKATSSSRASSGARETGWAPSSSCTAPRWSPCPTTPSTRWSTSAPAAAGPGARAGPRG